MYKLIDKKIGCAQRDHNKATNAKGKARCQNKYAKMDSYHEKHHARSQKKNVYKYHGNIFSPLTTSWKSRGSEFKDLNMFVNDKINKMPKEHGNDLHVMSNFEELLISSSNNIIKSSVSDTLAKVFNKEDSKLEAKK
eukprot:1691449-Ditylum_brightwellii.AAC.1